MVTSNRWQQLRAELRFTRSSSYLMSAFALTLFILPLVYEWMEQRRQSPTLEGASQ